MTPIRPGKFVRVGDILDLFVQMGCELRAAEATIEDVDGVWNVRYLVNPADKSIVGIVDLGDDEKMSIGEIEDWERRLAITIPKPA